MLVGLLEVSSELILLLKRRSDLRQRLLKCLNSLSLVEDLGVVLADEGPLVLAQLPQLLIQPL